MKWQDRREEDNMTPRELDRLVALKSARLGIVNPDLVWAPGLHDHEVGYVFAADDFRAYRKQVSSGTIEAVTIDIYADERDHPSDLYATGCANGCGVQIRG